jgi:hypothetical protein
MTRLPQHDQGNGGWQAQPPALAGPIAPSRKIRRVVRKTFPNGRVLLWVYRSATGATPEMIYVTGESRTATVLDCSCTPLSPDDAVCCNACSSIVCSRRHSATCASCGRVFCSACVKGIVIHNHRAIVCKACAEDLTSSRLAKVFKWLKTSVWG